MEKSEMGNTAEKADKLDVPEELILLGEIK